MLWDKLSPLLRDSPLDPEMKLRVIEALAQKKSLVFAEAVMALLEGWREYETEEQQEFMQKLEAIQMEREQEEKNILKKAEAEETDLLQDMKHAEEIEKLRKQIMDQHYGN